MNYSSRHILGRPQSSVSRNSEGIYIYIFYINVTIKISFWAILNELLKIPKGSQFSLVLLLEQGLAVLTIIIMIPSSGLCSNLLLIPSYMNLREFCLAQGFSFDGIMCFVSLCSSDGIECWFFIFSFFFGHQIVIYGSYFSPLLKSLTKKANIDYILIEEDPQERKEYIALLESRFLYLAADARSTLRFSHYAHHIELVSWNYICSVTEECKDSCMWYRLIEVTLTYLSHHVSDGYLNMGQSYPLFLCKFRRRCSFEEYCYFVYRFSCIMLWI